MIILDSNEINANVELLTPQSHQNIAVIPLKTEINNKLDILTLKKGMELGLVEVKELKQSTVNTLTVKNKAVTPLILIDGEEVVGGDQNRIVNETTVIAADSEAKISVSCTERGRWGYKSEFRSSENIADYNTRRLKTHALHKRAPVQSKVWSSIDMLEADLCCRSPTSAMSESYENQKSNLNEKIESFSIVDGQNGILIIINGEIKGFEIFLNHEVYKDFHEKVLKSYLINTEVKTTTFAINVDEARSVIQNAIDSSFESKETPTLEQTYEFENDEGIGTLYLFENEIIHWSYFIKDDEKVVNEKVGENGESEPDILEI